MAMARKSSESSAQGRQTKKKEKLIADSQIDYSDIPALSDEQLKKMKRVGRPLLGASKRLLIAVRVDPVVLRELKKEAKDMGKGYQTLINEILGRHVKRSAA